MKKLLSILTLGFVAFSSNIYAWNLCNGDMIVLQNCSHSEGYYYRGSTTNTSTGTTTSYHYIPDYLYKVSTIPTISTTYVTKITCATRQNGEQIHFNDIVKLEENGETRTFKFVDPNNETNNNEIVAGGNTIGPIAISYSGATTQYMTAGNPDTYGKGWAIGKSSSITNEAKWYVRKIKVDAQGNVITSSMGYNATIVN